MIKLGNILTFHWSFNSKFLVIVIGAPLWNTVLPSMNPSLSSLEPALPYKPTILYPSGNSSIEYEPPPPPYCGDLVPLFVTKPIESILLPDLNWTWVICSPSGTGQGSFSPPPCPPNLGDKTVVTPSLS